MTKLFPPVLTSLLLLTTAGLAAAEREFDASSFVNGKCVGCHDHGVYTRSNRRVNSLDGLERQVRMCDASLGTKLFNEDIAEVVHYLNHQYYKFK